MRTGPNSTGLEVRAVLPKSALGGAERWMIHLLSRPKSDRFSVTIMDTGSLADEIRALGIPVTEVPVGASPEALVVGMARIGRQICHERPGLVLANNVKAALVVLPAAVICRVPVVWVKHDPSYGRVLGRLVGQLCHAIIVVSKANAAGLPKSRTVIVIPGVEQEEREKLLALDRGDDSSAAGERPLSLVMLTRLVPNKGIDTAISALANVPRWELLVAGDDDPSFPGERARLRSIAERHGVADRVRIMDATPSALSLMVEADAAAVLSRPGEGRLPAREGFGLVVLEAALAGVPVLADERFVPSIEALGGAGVVCVDATSEWSVADALSRLLDNRLRYEIGACGRAAARSLPDANGVSDRVLAVIREAAARPRRGAQSERIRWRRQPKTRGRGWSQTDAGAGMAGKPHR